MVSINEIFERYEEEEKQEKLIDGKYRTLSKIAHGGFGDVYLGEKVDSSEKFAIKIEHQSVIPRNSGRLCHEYQISKILNGAVGFPKPQCFRIIDHYAYFVHELLGSSLESLFSKCHHRFSLKTVLMLADQMICRIEYFHNKYFINRDIKPDNFLIGHTDSNRSNIVYMIDFGLSKKYCDPNSLKHIPIKCGKDFTGTSRYATLSAHIGLEQSRKDDLESLAYSFVYFLRGHLPWQGIQTDDKILKCRLVSQKKQSVAINEVFDGLPKEFVDFFKDVQRLKFNERPDYAKYRDNFRQLFIRCGFVYDYEYDWIVLNRETERKKKYQALAISDSNKISPIENLTDDS